jgi:hypothetical protein
VRWWTGAGWSDLMTPAGPGVAVQHSPVLAPPLPESTSGAPDTFASPPANPRGRVIGIAVLAAVVLVVLGVVVARAGHNTPAPAPAAGPLSGSAPPSGPTFSPGTVRIIDDVAGISYPYLGQGWYEYDLGVQQETTAVAGQYFTTQESIPDGGIFIAQCTSGPVAQGYGWSGPASLQSTLHAVADSARGNYYPAPNEQKVLRDESRTVDGHAAWLFEFDLSWHVAGYNATGERAAMMLIDVGKPAPALLYLSIPNTHAELYGVIDQVLNDTHVL